MGNDKGSDMINPLLLYLNEIRCEVGGAAAAAHTHTTAAALLQQRNQEHLFQFHHLRAPQSHAPTHQPRQQYPSHHLVYFLIISVFQIIPSISVTNGTPTTLFPLAFVMLAVLIKDAYEEFCRYVKDKGENERTVETFDGVRFSPRSWESLQVGDIIKIRKEDFIPCDSLVIKTSDP
jgi:magnesium-transporting ATPase (P-type)